MEVDVSILEIGPIGRSRFYFDCAHQCHEFVMRMVSILLSPPTDDRRVAVIGSHQATELTVSRGDRPNTPIVPNLVGSGYLLCLNYTARKSSRSSCAGEGVVIDHALPGDFEFV